MSTSFNSNGTMQSGAVGCDITTSPAHASQFSYDANGNLASRTDANPITLQDANRHTTTNSFDLLGEITGKTLPDGNLTETRHYDQNGNLTSLTHFNGVTTTYTYDNLNRLLSRTTPNEAPVSFTYTPTGKRQTMIDASGTTTYTYDSMDRLVTKATPEGTLTYTYDAAGNLASMASGHTNGVSVTYTYDELNRLSSVVDGTSRERAPQRTPTTSPTTWELLPIRTASTPDSPMTS